MTNVGIRADSGSAQCGMCGADQLKETFRATDRNLVTTREIFVVARCRVCGITQTLPQPSETAIARYYPRVYYPDPELACRYYEHVARAFHLEKLSRLKRYAPGGRLLDVGCGIGYFVKAAADHGYDAEGLELNEQIASRGRELWKLPIRAGTFSSQDAAGAVYDVVTFWQAFEHMHRPREVLETVRSLLRPGGLLVIGVPNFSSLQSVILRSHWYHLDVPRHLFHYDPENLAALVTRQGFNVERVCFHSREHDWAGILGSVMKLAPTDERLLHKVVRKTVGYHISRALAAIEASIHRGGTFELYATKV